MARYLLLVFLTGFIVTTGSCIEKCKTIACDSYAQTDIVFLDFTQQELEKVVIKSYLKGQQFARASRLDSIVLTRDNNLVLEPDYSNNQALHIRRRDLRYIFDSRYDYVIETPSTGNRWEIDQITDLQSEMEYCSPSLQRKDCMNSQLRSSRINGEVKERPVIPELSR